MWDIILTEKWTGLFKCLLYIIESNKKIFLTCNENEILKHIGVIKTTNFISKMFNENDFKEFCYSLKIDEK